MNKKVAAPSPSKIILLVDNDVISVTLSNFQSLSSTNSIKIEMIDIILRSNKNSFLVSIHSQRIRQVIAMLNESKLYLI